MLRDIYTGENIWAFDNEIDAFETVMSLVEEKEYNQYLRLTLVFNYDEPIARKMARETAEYFIEGLYFQEFPYLPGDFSHIKEDD
jgi:hypothetical protein